MKRFPFKIEIITPLGAADHLPTASPPLLLPDRLLSLPDPHQRRLQPRSIVHSSLIYSSYKYQLRQEVIYVRFRCDKMKI